MVIVAVATPVQSARHPRHLPVSGNRPETSMPIASRSWDAQTTRVFE